MADYGNIETMLSGIDDSLRRVFKSVFQYLLKDIRFGRAVDGDPSKNFGGGFFKGTTPANANDEFIVPHTFGRTPYLVFQVIPLNTVGAKIVRLENARAADSNNLYLKSPETDATIYLYVEG